MLVLWLAEAAGRALWASDRVGLAFVGAMLVQGLTVAGVVVVVGRVLRRKRVE